MFSRWKCPVWQRCESKPAVAEISLPVKLMAALGLQDGDEVKMAVEGPSLRLTPLDQFLALRGALREDESFDTAIEFLKEAWLSWTVPVSA